VKFRYGFKAEAERIAAQTREELGLSVTDRIDLKGLTKHWGIPVHSFRELARYGLSADSLQCLCKDEQDQLSGVTLFKGHKRMIFINDQHSETRQASDLAHEMGHCLLEHEPQPFDFGAGKRCWNGEVEDEATWLGSALLIPREGAFQLLRDGYSIESIAARYGVSSQFCSMRVYSDGIKTHVERWAARRRMQ
jgi:Zn-dependent peptidase ImmA (M78 family)